MNPDNKKEILLFCTMLAVILTGFLAYHSYKLSNLKDSYSEDLTSLKTDLSKRDEMLAYQIKSLQNNFDSQINTIQQQFKTTNTNINNELNNKFDQLKEQNLDISDQITNLLTQSTSKIDVLESQLRTMSSRNIDFSNIIQNIITGTVSVDTLSGKSAGVIVDKDGYVVTSYHAIKNENNIVVTTSNKKRYVAKLIDSDSFSDIALLKIEADNLKPLEFGDSNKIRIGEKVIALGNPIGLDFTVTEGIISAVNRKGPNGQTYIQTDVPINPGNSGGPLINSEGKVIGINLLKVADLEGVSLAIPSNKVSKLVQQFMD